MDAASLNASQCAIQAHCMMCGASLHARRAGLRYCMPCGRAVGTPAIVERARLRSARQRREQQLLMVDRERASQSRRVPVRRPHARGKCKDGPRPCPWASCRYHLEVERLGVLRRQPGDPLDLRADCALDGTERDGMTDSGSGRLFTIRREGVSLIADRALARLRCTERDLK